MTTPTPKGYINRTEAAQMMGVSPQSISNYMARGLIRGKKHGNVVIIKRDSFEAFLNDTAKPIVEREEGLRTVIEELDKARKEAAEARDRALLEKELAKTHGSYLRLASAGYFTRVMCDIIETFGILKTREADVLADIAYGRTHDEEAALFGMPRERIKQIFDKACTKLVQRAKDLTECEKENKRLIAKASMQHDTIKKLQETVSKYEKELELKRRKKPLMVAKLERELRSTYVTDWLIDAGASVRLVNCINNMEECDTLYDLVTKTKSDIMLCRNMGKKTLNELTDILFNHNLTLNMRFI